ncbi:tellurite resistance TerB family protein [Pseudomonas cavernicola]|uniref:Tellurite resistance TerB family protein n=1 Tax=Pseudomonas cavernicola TaxID=2320866 RepID=A0A418XD24_9PSED|nr:tellurite resistance TerB family protein [Pseudomonas cavernicola]RJG10208.1 tellurite resistance TerB family protein [Pseudomonas cavernicola]
MNTSDLLEQLLSSGLAQQGGAASRASATQGGLGGLLGGALGDLLGGGAAGGGVSSGGGSQGGLGGLGGLLGGLLGGGAPSGQARSSSGMGYGGLATLGMLAFQAFSAWQQQQASARTSMQPETVNQLTGAAAEEHSHAILRALIAASKADGRIDEQEKKLIYAEIAKLTDDPELQDWLDQEVSRPLDAAQVAQAAQTPEMAAEMYLASVLLVGSQQGGERDYLDELARQLKLDPALKAELEAQLGSGLQG